MNQIDLTTFTTLRDSQGKVHLILGFPREIDILEEGKNPEHFSIDEVIHLLGDVTVYLVCTNREICTPYSTQDRDFAISLVRFYRYLHKEIYGSSTSNSTNELQRPSNAVGNIQAYDY